MNIVNFFPIVKVCRRGCEKFVSSAFRKAENFSLIWPADKIGCIHSQEKSH